MQKYDISAVSIFAGLEVEAESAEEALEKTKEEVENELKGGNFQLTEIEAEAQEGNEWDIWEL